jgi:UDP-N-acetylglucosamine transferase subunit ALG13
VPDVDTRPNLSGKLGRLKKNLHNIVYIGAISRFEKADLPIKYKLLVVLSGPEPQRTLLEEKLIVELESYVGDILFVKGKVEEQQRIEQVNHITFYNYMNSDQLQLAFNESNLVLCRSGYTTIMDLAKLEKKAFFIPTPGQYEQEYLAKKLKREGLVPYCNQDDFTVDKLFESHIYMGLKGFGKPQNWSKLFSLFERE